jgi:hypothetical protein
MSAWADFDSQEIDGEGSDILTLTCSDAKEVEY